LHWEKPSLGLVAYKGSVDNNIVLQPGERFDSPSIVYDPDDRDASRRYKMIYRLSGDGGIGLYAAFSSDGVAWNPVPGPVAPSLGDRTNAMFTRDKAGKYVVLTRKRDMMQRYKTRCVYRIESDDFIHWSPAELVLKPDLADGPNMQFYSMTGFEYGDQYLGCVERMHTVPDVLDIELTTSRDGCHWQRIQPRQAFIAREKDWEGNWVHVPSNPPIKYQGRLWWFYCGRHYRHGAMDPHRDGRIGMATSRIDGFVSIEGGPEEGRLLTKVLTWPGGELEINADTRTAGTDYFRLYDGAIRLAVLDADVQEIPGFSLDEAMPFIGDTEVRNIGQKYHRPQWTSGRKMSQLQDQKIRLAFYIQSARLYAFRSVAPSETESQS
jgi:hypothetical protein